MNKNTFKRYESIFDLLVYRYLINNSLENTWYKFREYENIQEAVSIPQLYFVQTFGLKWKWKGLKMQPLMKYFFHLEKIILKGKCEVRSLVWQIIVITLNNNKQTNAQVHRGRKTYFCSSQVLHWEGLFPSFKGHSHFLSLPITFREGYIDSVPFCVCWFGWKSQRPISNFCMLRFAVQPVLWARMLGAACRARSVGGPGLKVRASGVNLNHFTSDHGPPTCPTGCGVFSRPSKVTVLPIRSLETFSLACCTQAKTPSASSNYSSDHLEYSMLLLGEEAQLKKYKLGWNSATWKYSACTEGAQVQDPFFFLGPHLLGEGNSLWDCGLRDLV